ncbi:hypothetical protein S40293_10788 [Stachybotrys chartarum IBT 40293]|nr:hypothetical protein S40293_10788 [Stachybotrys chartarum IBT 40293]KFA80524.1 hypothetical protein S40288_10687 [Stachybotrys chartarum IBT 40288]
MSIGRYFISDAVLRDHRQIEALYDNILQTTDTDERSRRTKNLIDEVIRHCHAEEVILHPVFETQGHRGKTILKRDRATYEKVKVQVSRLQELAPSDDDFKPCLEALYLYLKQHIIGEDRCYLAALEASIEEERSEELAQEFRNFGQGPHIRMLTERIHDDGHEALRPIEVGVGDIQHYEHLGQQCILTHLMLHLVPRTHTSNEDDQESLRPDDSAARNTQSKQAIPRPIP